MGSWNETYALKIVEIDNQHKQIFDLFDKLLLSMKSGKGNLVIKSVLKELNDYAKIHFTKEEQYMIKFQYEKYKEHKEAHEYFCQRVNDISEKVDSGNSTAVLELMDFLKKWLIKHINGTDTLYKPLFEANGVK